ncbi:hypothetical protein SAMN05192529_102160 [Arachidicoccus rhizosphaerae]|uniref:Glycosyltransferase 2-like domain-containing protein n=1 Tax=Arachidicoccus rhizosphaerae TaxID=551991 RepID=A0A1H3W823_9BACT|nr:glycosyltransferase family 2 protein [Arachidicoccus rhizosphaerae]SDZ82492.1 hypothetical protein SAMN05192529_102160 [Arachidicoccus rhizosphaerae]
MHYPLVAIVILNFNGRKFLEKFLPSVLASTYPNYKVVVADNGSTDDSAAFMKAAYPDIELDLLGMNYGFAEGYNQALLKRQEDYFILLNSDVEVVPGWMEPVIALMEANEKLAICQPKILSYKQKDQFEYAGAAGGFIDVLGYPFARGRVFDTIEQDRHQFKTSVNVFWASGCALFAKAAVYKQLGGLYGVFFAHQEEIDFCWRAQNAGFKIGCCTESVVYHVGGGTLPKGYRKTFLNFRNSLMMLSRNLSKREKWWKIPVRLVLDGVFAIKSLFSGDFTSLKAIWNAHMAFYKWCFSKPKVKDAPNKPMSMLSGIYEGSVVAGYFIKEKKKFEDFSK